MRRNVLARRCAIVLGFTYLLLGAAETVRLVATGDGGFLFWFGTLVGAGTLLLFGALPRRQSWDGQHRFAVLTGAVLGVPATAWSLVVPVLAITVVVLAVISTSDPVLPASEPGSIDRL